LPNIENQGQQDDELKYAPLPCRVELETASKLSTIKRHISFALISDCRSLISYQKECLGYSYRRVTSNLQDTDSDVQIVKNLHDQLQYIETEINQINPHQSVWIDDQIRSLKDKKYFSKLHQYKQKIEELMKKVDAEFEKFKTQTDDILARIQIGTNENQQLIRTDLRKIRLQILAEPNYLSSIEKHSKLIEMWSKLLNNEIEQVSNVIVALQKLKKQHVSYALSEIQQDLHRDYEILQDQTDLHIFERVHHSLISLDEKILKNEMSIIWINHIKNMINIYSSFIELHQNSSNSDEVAKDLNYRISQLKWISNKLFTCTLASIRPCEITKSPSQGMEFFGNYGRCIKIYVIANNGKKLLKCVF